jgi:D-glycero-alpha-D-manno-heptose-7-phosphate kinase
MIIKGRAPLRLGLAGGGTDLNDVFEKYGGCVINATIDKYVHAEVSKGYCSVNGGQPDTFTKILLDKLGVKNVKINTWCEVPWGRGLGSSSTYSILLAKLIMELKEIKKTDNELAQLVYGVENTLGKCGWQDQYASLKGGFNWMEFGKEKNIYPLRIKNKTINELEERLCLVYSGITHNSGMVQSSKSQLSEEKVYKLKELAIKTRNCLLEDNIEPIGLLLNEGWKIKKEDATTSPEIEKLYDLGIKSGAIGGKVSGAGKGGYILFFIPPEKMYNFREQMKKNNFEILDFKFTNKGVETWT